MRSMFAGVVVSCVVACAAEPDRLVVDEQAIMQNQGPMLQGVQLLGTQVQGLTLKGFQADSAKLHGSKLTNLHVDKGELVAMRGNSTVRGTALEGAHLMGQLQDAAGAITLVMYELTAIEPEVAAYDPTATGNTFLYTLSQEVDHTGVYQPVCGADQDGRHVAIATTAIWDAGGNRVVSGDLFSLSCTTGAIAKCYRWGYRPWVTGHGDLTAAHWACTRLARADYCGTGEPHTMEGTLINVWDELMPAPIEPHGTTPMGMTFEAGWNTGGALCLSHARWALDGPLVTLGCRARLAGPGHGAHSGVCDTVAEAHGLGPAILFDESAMNGP